MALTEEKKGKEAGPLKVGLVVYDAKPQVSGHELYLRHLARALGELGASVDWVPIESQGYALNLVEGFGLDVAESLALYSIDAFLVDGQCHPSLGRWSHRLRGPSRKPKQVAIVQELKTYGRSLWSRLAWPVEARFLSAMDACVYASPRVQGQVEQMVGRRLPCVVAPPGRDHIVADVTEEQIQKRVLEPKRLRLLFLGHVTERKGLLPLITAFERWPKGPWLLDVAGSLEIEPKYVAKVKERIEAADLTDRVEFHGVVHDELLKRLLARNHALVMPAAQGGVGFSYLEAMGFGLPVVGAQNGPAADLVTHGEEGYLVNPKDSLSILEAIQPWARDRTTLLKMSFAARRRYMAQPSWMESAAQITRWLPTLVGTRTE